MDWIDLAQNRDGLRGLVNAVMNLRFPKKMPEISWLAEGPLASQETHCSLTLVIQSIVIQWPTALKIHVCVVWDKALRRWVCTVQQLDGTRSLHLEDPVVRPLEDTRNLRNVWHSSYVPTERRKDVRRIWSSTAAPWDSQSPQISVI